jgi:hypothetical protein
MRLGPALGVPRQAFRQVEPPVDHRLPSAGIGQNSPTLAFSIRPAVHLPLNLSIGAKHHVHPGKHFDVTIRHGGVARWFGMSSAGAGHDIPGCQQPTPEFLELPPKPLGNQLRSAQGQQVATDAPSSHL